MSGFHLVVLILSVTLVFYDYRDEVKSKEPQCLRLFVGLILLRVCAVLLSIYACHHLMG